MTDPAELRKYRIELPNLIDDSDLSVYAFRLYVHVKRVAGANGGSCHQGTRTLARTCRMSVGEVVKAKQELIKNGWVSHSTVKTNGGETDNLTPIDRWQENYEVYSKGVHTVNTAVQDTNTLDTETGKGVHLVNEGVHTVNTGVHQVNERKNQLRKNNKEEKESDTLYQPMFAAIATACQIDLKLCTAAQRNQVAQTTKALRKAGKLPEDVPKVETWWYEYDWRGKKGSAPRPAQLQEVWLQATEQRNGNLRQAQPNNGRHPDPRAEWAGFTETDYDKPF